MSRLVALICMIVVVLAAKDYSTLACVGITPELKFHDRAFLVRYNLRVQLSVHVGRAFSCDIV
jgi:hypothetical protein